MKLFFYIVLLMPCFSVFSSITTHKIIQKTKPLPAHYIGQKTLDSNQYPLMAMKIEAYRKNAEFAQRTLRKTLGKIAGKVGGKTIAAVPKNIKSFDSMMRKFSQVAQFDPRKLTDISRGSLVFQNMDLLQKGLQLIKSQYQVVREVNRFENPWEDGYRDIQLNIVDPDTGIIQEVILTLCHLKKYTEKESHHIYEHVRVIKGKARLENRALTKHEQDEIDNLNAQSRKGFEHALQEAEMGRSCSVS